MTFPSETEQSIASRRIVRVARDAVRSRTGRALTNLGWLVLAGVLATACAARAAITAGTL